MNAPPVEPTDEPINGRRGFPWITAYAARLARRFGLDRAGATALEFALIMPPFLLITFGIIETTLVMFVATQLEGSVQEAARQIRTGNVQTDGDPVAAFRTLLCNSLETVVTCDDRLVIDVRKYSRFDQVNPPPFLDENGQDNGSTFDPGGAGEIVVVRVAFNWNIKTPMLGRLLADDGSSRKLLMASTSFRNEPFDGIQN